MKASVGEPLKFMNPEDSGPEGLVGMGGVLNTTNLRSAYQQGVFPWPHDGYPLLWFCPDPRGVLDFTDLHISDRNRSYFKKAEKNWTITVGKDFSGVLNGCKSQVRKSQNGTWITPEIQNAYAALFAAGGALSVEVWEGADLVGGIYGVLSNNYFSAESMFHIQTGASKWAFVNLVKYLESQGQTWMDIQMLTSVSESLGGKLIPRADFLRRIQTGP